MRATWLALGLLAACRATVVEPKLPPAWPEELANEPLSRARCVELAIQSAPTDAAWRARMLAARANLDRAELLPNPTLSISWEDFGLFESASNPVQTTASLAVALEDVFARKRRAAAAEHELDAVAADLGAEATKLAASVSRAHDELLAARSRVELENELVAIAERERADVERFVASGLAPHIDLERTEAELEEAKATQLAAGNDARRRELELAFALGFERPVSLRLSDVLAIDGDSQAPELVDLLATAASSRSEIAAAAARYSAELERLKLAAERIQFLPTIGGGPRTIGGALTGVASIDAVLPVFDTGKVGERAQEASLLAAAASVRAVARDVTREVCTSLEELTAAETYRSEHARDLAHRRSALRERTERLFRAGQVPYTELALARRDEVAARIALADADLAVDLARLDLDAATGVLRPPQP